jgi:hypothetical protein
MSIACGVKGFRGFQKCFVEKKEEINRIVLKWVEAAPSRCGSITVRKDDRVQVCCENSTEMH